MCEHVLKELGFEHNDDEIVLWLHGYFENQGFDHDQEYAIVDVSVDETKSHNTLQKISGENLYIEGYGLEVEIFQDGSTEVTIVDEDEAFDTFSEE